MEERCGFLQSVCACVCVRTHAHLVVSNSLPPHGQQPTRPLCPWDSQVRMEWLPIPPAGGLPDPETED